MVTGGEAGQPQGQRGRHAADKVSCATWGALSVSQTGAHLPILSGCHQEDQDLGMFCEPRRARDPFIRRRMSACWRQAGRREVGAPGARPGAEEQCGRCCVVGELGGASWVGAGVQRSVGVGVATGPPASPPAPGAGLPPTLKVSCHNPRTSQA